jgi:CubicO group peptidase (beta-lactamase class C family)
MASAVTEQTELDADLRAFVEERMAHYHVPGVAVGVYHEGVQQVGGMGVTNVDHPLNVNERTLFQIGSTSKTFCGTLAMVLVEQGKLDLNAPVRTYLPDLKLQDEEAAARVTVRDCFTHVGGWTGDYFEDCGAGEDALARVVAKMAEIPQVYPLGKFWSYNNSAFYIAGRVIEVLTGKPYETAMQELVFDPLGLNHTFFFARDVITERVVAGHIVRDGVPTVARAWELARTANPAGGITSDVIDQLAYARFHMGDGTADDGTRVLSKESIDFMQQPIVPKGVDGEMALTWHLYDIDGTRIVRHGGATVGQLSSFDFVPSKRFAVTVLTNANRGGELHGDVKKWALKRYLGLEEPESQPREATEEQLRPYVGKYDAALTSVELTLQEGGLILQATPKGGFPDRARSMPAPPPPPVRVALVDDDVLMALDEPMKGGKGEILRNADGSVGWLRFGGRIARRVG